MSTLDGYSTFRADSPPTIVRFAPATLLPTPRQVARYAGGSRYRFDGPTGALAAEVIALAGQLIAPVMTYNVHRVSSIAAEGTVLLESGLSLALAGHELDAQTKCLAAAICTLGPELEAKCRQFMKAGDFLRSLFLDAAGVAVLEALGERSYKLLSLQAKSMGLFTGCRFGPGYEKMPMTVQTVLFGLVSGEAIGVHLNKSLVMNPSKSLSFFVGFTSEATSARNPYKCRECSLTDCSFRLGRDHSPCDLKTSAEPSS